jgi:hypothetical protein
VTQARDALANEEQYCLQMLDVISKAYRDAAKPYVERLMRIRSVRGPSSIQISAKQLLELQRQGFLKE